MAVHYFQSERPYDNAVRALEDWSYDSNGATIYEGPGGTFAVAKFPGRS